MSIEELYSKVKLLDKEREDLMNQIRRAEPVSQGQLEDVVRNLEQKIESLDSKVKETASIKSNVSGGYTSSKLSYSEFLPSDSVVKDTVVKTVNTTPETCVDTAKLYSRLKSEL